MWSQILHPASDIVKVGCEVTHLLIALTQRLWRRRACNGHGDGVPNLIHYKSKEPAILSSGPWPYGPTSRRQSWTISIKVKDSTTRRAPTRLQEPPTHLPYHVRRPSDKQRDPSKARCLPIKTCKQGLCYQKYNNALSCTSKYQQLSLFHARPYQTIRASQRGPRRQALRSHLRRLQTFPREYQNTIK